MQNFLIYCHRTTGKEEREQKNNNENMFCSSTSNKLFTNLPPPDVSLFRHSMFLQRHRQEKCLVTAIITSLLRPVVFYDL